MCCLGSSTAGFILFLSTFGLHTIAMHAFELCSSLQAGQQSQWQVCTPTSGQSLQRHLSAGLETVGIVPVLHMLACQNDQPAGLHPALRDQRRLAQSAACEVAGGTLGAWQQLGRDAAEGAWGLLHMLSQAQSVTA